MLDKGATTLWESFAPTASLCHGFSAGPTYHLSQNLAGLHPFAEHFGMMWFQPKFAELDWVQAEVATDWGPYGVTWRKTGPDRIEADVNMPPEVNLLVQAPEGWRTPALSFDRSAYRQTHKIVFERMK
jgi:hypothetical protein